MLDNKWRNANARVTKELHAKLQEYAEFSEVSMGYVIRQALQEYIWAHPLKTEDVQEKRAERELKLKTILTEEA